MKVEELISKLKDGGKIISSNDMTIGQIAVAKQLNCFYVDPDGFGFAYIDYEQCMYCEKVVQYQERIVICGECGGRE